MLTFLILGVPILIGAFLIGVAAWYAFFGQKNYPQHSETTHHLNLSELPERPEIEPPKSKLVIPPSSYSPPIARLTGDSIGDVSNGWGFPKKLKTPPPRLRWGMIRAVAKRWR